MAPSTTHKNSAMRETFLPGQIFVFGGLALRANLIGHLEQIDSYAPGHQISFGNLNYVADIRGDLIFQGFTASTAAPTLDPEHLVEFEDGSLEPAGPFAGIELNTGDTEGIVSPANPESLLAPSILIEPDSPPCTSSELSRSVLHELDQGNLVPPHSTDSRFLVHTSPLHEALDLM